MNKRQIISSLNNIANSLDNSGYYHEATNLTKVMVRIADEFNISDSPSDEITNEPKSKIDEELKRRVLGIIASDEYKDWEIKRAIGALVNYVFEPDSRQEYLEQIEEMYPLGRPIPKSQSLMLNLMFMTDNYIKEKSLSYKQIKDLYFTFMDI